MSDFITLVQGNGVLGLIVGFIVLVSVYALDYGGVVVTKGQKQLSNVVLSILLAGINLSNPQNADVIVATIASFGSALAHEFIGWLGVQAKLKASK